MKKSKLLTLILVPVLLFVCGIALTACSGKNGTNGNDGKSAYQIWLEQPGNSGKSETDFLNWLKGQDGTNGTNGQDLTACTHTWGDWITSATCETAGVEFRVCTKDSTHNEIRLAAALGHDLDWIVTDSTYYVDGYETGTCTRAGCTHTETKRGGTAGISYYSIKGGDEYEAYFHFDVPPVDLSDMFIPATRNGKPVTGIRANGFEGLIDIYTVTIPASVTTIGNSAFMNCSKLETVIFAGGSNLEIIDAFAFYGCNKLKSITLPASVTTIGPEAFCDCDNLTIYAEVSFDDKPVTWDGYWNRSDRPVFWDCELDEDENGLYVVSWTVEYGVGFNFGAPNGYNAPYRKGYTFDVWNAYAAWNTLYHESFSMTDLVYYYNNGDLIAGDACLAIWIED